MPAHGPLAVLLIGALLLCHGVFGALHAGALDRPVPAGHSDMPQAAAETGDTSHDKKPSAHEFAGAGYFAVLLTALGALVLLALTRRARLWTRAPVALSLDPHFLGYIPHLPRGPTIPHLQVFRL